MQLDKDKLNLWLLKKSFSLNKRLSLYEKLVAFLESDMTLVSSLTLIRDRYAGKSRTKSDKKRVKRDSRAKIIDDWLNKLRQGRSFDQAIKDWIPPSELMLIQAGYETGNLITGLKEAAKVSLAAAETRKVVYKSLSYPGILMTVLLAVFFVFQYKIAPTFETMLELPDWPASPKMLYAITSFVTGNIVFIIIGFALLAGLIGRTLGTWIRPPRPFFDKFPPWSIYKISQGSSFLIALSALMTSGTPYFQAIQQIHKNASPWMRQHLEMMMAALKFGSDNPGEALDTGLLSPELAGEVQDYSRTVDFDKAIDKLGNIALVKGIKNVGRIAGVVKGMLIFIVIICILWIYSSSFAINMAISSKFGQ